MAKSVRANCRIGQHSKLKTKLKRRDPVSTPVKISWQRLFDFSQIASIRLKEEEDENKKNQTTKKSKLSYALGRMLAQAQRHQTKIQEKLGDIRESHYAADADGFLIESSQRIILRDGSQQIAYRTKKEELPIQTQEERALINTADLEIDPYFATKLPPDLQEHELLAFTDIVITKETADKYRADMEEYLDALDLEDSLAEAMHSIRQLDETSQRMLAARILGEKKFEALVEEMEDHLDSERDKDSKPIPFAADQRDHVVSPS